MRLPVVKGPVARRGLSECLTEFDRKPYNFRLKKCVASYRQLKVRACSLPLMFIQIAVI
jgi:hypothetical protein